MPEVKGVLSSSDGKTVRKEARRGRGRKQELAIPWKFSQHLQVNERKEKEQEGREGRGEGERRGEREGERERGREKLLLGTWRIFLVNIHFDRFQSEGVC